MSGPPTCSSCQREALLWRHRDEAAGPGRAHVDGECYCCSKLAAMANGGLPVADLRPLDRMLNAMDRSEEHDHVRSKRGLRYMYEGAVLSV